MAGPFIKGSSSAARRVDAHSRAHYTAGGRLDQADHRASCVSRRQAAPHALLTASPNDRWSDLRPKMGCGTTLCAESLEACHSSRYNGGVCTRLGSQWKG